MIGYRFACGLALAVAVLAAPIASAQDTAAPKVDAAGKILLAAKAHYDMGRYDKARYEMAAAAYAAFLKQYPNDKRVTAARYGLGACFYHLRQYEKAAAEMALVVAVKGFEKHNDAMLVLCYCHLVLKDYAKAVTVSDKLIAEAPKSAQALNAGTYRIQALYFGGKLPECVKACEGFVETFPTVPSRFIARYFQGQSLRKLKRFSEAITALVDLVGQINDPRRVDAMELSALCYRDLSQFGLAESMYRKMLKVAPAGRQAGGHYGLAVVLYDAKKYADAIAECKIAIAAPKCPYIPAARFRLGLAQFADEKYSEAIKTFKLVQEGDATRAAKAAYWLARCDMALEKHNVARTALLELAKGKVDNAEQIAFDVAMCSLLAEKFGQAAADFQAYRKAHSKGQHAVETLYHEAFCLHKLAKYTESQALCEQVAKAPACAITPAAAELSAENLLLGGQYAAGEKAFAALAEAAVAAKDGEREFRFRVRQGQCAQLAGQHVNAVKLLTPLAADKRLAADEDLREAILQLGESLLAIRQYGDAAVAITKYLAGAKQYKARAQCELGIAYLRDEKPAEAGKAFAAGMAVQDGSTWVIRSAFMYGDLAYRQGQPAKAAPALAKVLASKDAPPELAGGAAYLTAFIDYNAKKYTTAAQRFGQMVKDYPQHASAPDAAFQQGCCTMLDGDHAAALVLLQAYIKAHGADDNVVRAKHMAARCMAETAQHAEAKAAYAALAGDAKTVSDEALYGLAWAQRETKAPDEAIATYRRLIKDFPESKLLTSARTELGGMLYLKKDYAAAVVLLDAVLADKTADAALLAAAGYQVGCCYEKLGDDVKTASAMGAFAAAFPKHENAPSALYQAGVAQAKLQMYDKAIVHFTALVAGFPRHDLLANAQIKLGQVQNESRQYDAAAKTFGAYLAKFPNGDWAYLARFGMGWSLESRKKY
ncbi:MAG: tetratricopeptide repeat protein, partial [Phycisphaerae bacterium]|nr:tetratricopeptide repeat protein [Phycisphaerae bacterium]